MITMMILSLSIAVAMTMPLVWVPRGLTYALLYVSYYPDYSIDKNG